MKQFLSILAILLSMAAASAEAQGPTATFPESNDRYSQDQMIVLFKSCAPHAALSTMLAVAITESGFHPYAISVNSPQKIASRFGLSNQAIELQRQPNSKLEAVLWMRWLLQHRIDGICIYGNFLDFEWDAMRWAHDWIQKVGETKL